jgi:hypothetical protein
MPAGDRTGPGGWGSMTGRGLGYCAGYGAPGLGRGRGAWGAGRGWGGGGRGWRHQYYATGLPGWARYGYPPFGGYVPYPQSPSTEEETDLLKNQAQALQRELDAINKRLDELEKEA